jgi:hypothetical protein
MYKGIDLSGIHIDDAVDALDAAIASQIELWNLFKDEELRALFIDELIDEFVSELKGI